MKLVYELNYSNSEVWIYLNVIQIFILVYHNNNNNRNIYINKFILIFFNLLKWWYFKIKNYVQIIDKLKRIYYTYINLYVCNTFLWLLFFLSLQLFSSFSLQTQLQLLTFAFRFPWLDSAKGSDQRSDLGQIYLVFFSHFF